VLGVATGCRDVAAIVAEATAKDGLPLFTAVRIRSVGDRLTLVATDRFRAAIATVPWQRAVPKAPAALPSDRRDRPDATDRLGSGDDGHGGNAGNGGSEDAARRGGGADGFGGRAAEVDVLVPAAALASAVRFADHDVPVRAADGWFGVDWPGGGTVLPQLALPFPDAQIATLLTTDPIATIDVDADTLLAAVDRVAPFAPDGIVLDIADGVIAIRGAGELGEAREDVKASTVGGHATVRYQPRYLAAAVRAYAGRRLTIQVQQGIRPTVFESEDLKYLVVPLRLPGG
jgi:DNA polymerase-3 subunit beta